MYRPETKIKRDVKMYATNLLNKPNFREDNRKNFTSYFPVVSLRHSLVSGIYIAVVNLTWIVQ
jgi:hypothetical protein